MNNIFHFTITSILRFIYSQYSLILLVSKSLVEDTQHFLQVIIHLTSEQRNLYDDAVVLQTLHKRIRLIKHYLLPLVVVNAMLGIDHRLVDFTYTMPQQIHCNRRKSILVVRFFRHILLVVILQGEILTEA